MSKKPRHRGVRNSLGLGLWLSRAASLRVRSMMMSLGGEATPGICFSYSFHSTQHFLVVPSGCFRRASHRGASESSAEGSKMTSDRSIWRFVCSFGLTEILVSLWKKKHDLELTWP